MTNRLLEAVAAERPYNGTGPNVVASFQVTPPTDRPFIVSGVHRTERTTTHIQIALTRDEARRLADDLREYVGDDESGRFAR